jgi:hypothetical protein
VLSGDRPSGKTGQKGPSTPQISARQAGLYILACEFNEQDIVLVSNLATHDDG